MEFSVGGLHFSSKFDSGNLARVVNVLSDNDDTSTTSAGLSKPTQAKQNTCNNNASGNVRVIELKVDYDFKVWTKPDCADTPFENGNRTWFHFSVRGYAPAKLIRITVMNMNKQSKLYSQGYCPFYRVVHSTPSQSRWQRIRDKPAWDYVDGQFILSFVHRFMDPRGSTTYFAFCFPWTYSETQKQLSQIEGLFGNQKVPPLTTQEDDITGPTICSRSMLDESSVAAMQQQIYFHRELLCYSLEGRRIDLLTITDWSGLLEQREDFFDPLLFPDRCTPRPWKFKHKKGLQETIVDFGNSEVTSNQLRMSSCSERTTSTAGDHISERSRLAANSPATGFSPEVVVTLTSPPAIGHSVSCTESDVSVPQVLITSKLPPPTLPSVFSKDGDCCSQPRDAGLPKQFSRSASICLQADLEVNDTDMCDKTEPLRCASRGPSVSNRTIKNTTREQVKRKTPTPTSTRRIRTMGKCQRTVSDVSNRLSTIGKSCKSSKLLSALKARRRPLLKVDCLPCLFTKLNATSLRLTTTKSVCSGSRRDKADRIRALLGTPGSFVYKPSKLWPTTTSSVDIVNKDRPPSQARGSQEAHTNAVESSDVINRGGLKHYSKEAGEKTVAEQTGVMRTVSLESLKVECKGENLLHKATTQVLGLDVYSFKPPDCEPGNEGSDDESCGNIPKAETDDLSINAHYLNLMDQLRVFVEHYNICNGTPDAPSTVEFGHVLEQLHRLRKGDHLSDPVLRCFKGSSGVAFYLDLHGHCSKRGCFLYGNWLEREDDMLNNVLFAVLIGVNSGCFDFGGCNFSVRNMYQRDRKGNLTKEGSGRVAIWKHLGLIHCYTMECNYNSGPMMSRIARCLYAAPPDEGGRLTPPGTFVGPYWTDVANSHGIRTLNGNGPLPGLSLCTEASNNQPNQQQQPSTTVAPTANTTPSAPVRFTPAHFEEVGRAMLFAILDLNQTNPWPRLSNLAGSAAVPGVGLAPPLTGLMEFSSMRCLRDWVRRYIRSLVNTASGGPSGQCMKGTNPKSTSNEQCTGKHESAVAPVNVMKSARTNQQRRSAPLPSTVSSTSVHGAAINSNKSSGAQKELRTSSLPERRCPDAQRYTWNNPVLVTTNDSHSVAPRALEALEHWSVFSGKLDCAMTSLRSKALQMHLEQFDATSPDASLSAVLSTEGGNCQRKLSTKETISLNVVACTNNINTSNEVSTDHTKYTGETLGGNKNGRKGTEIQIRDVIANADCWNLHSSALHESLLSPVPKKRQQKQRKQFETRSGTKILPPAMLAKSSHSSRTSWPYKSVKWETDYDRQLLETLTRRYFTRQTSTRYGRSSHLQGGGVGGGRARQIIPEVAVEEGNCFDYFTTKSSKLFSVHKDRNPTVMRSKLNGREFTSVETQKLPFAAHNLHEVKIGRDIKQRDRTQWWRE
ncbi:unnamed protein product [Dicrocoelium dendriticum]|nr:unnamed protein product [Dicrocoelium dendriticum]